MMSETIRLQTMRDIIRGFNNYLDELDEHIKKADLGWFNNLAVQEWYLELCELVRGSTQTMREES